MSPGVDVIVRTKDRPTFLERALRDIRVQTFTNWRAIVINDGGDPVVFNEVIQRSGIRDRVVVLNHETNRGMVPSANFGLQESEAPLIVLHDDDDTWHPDFLARGVKYLEENEDAPGVVARIEIVWERLEGDVLIETGREPFQPQLTALFLADVLLFNRFVPIGFLYRRELHDEVGGYREDLPVVDDWDFHRRILTRGPLEYMSDEVLAFWHQRPGVDGVAGNSVIVQERNHRHFDALVRDEMLREHVQREGAGDLLYLTKFIDQRFWDLEHHVDGLARAQEQRIEEVRRELHEQIERSHHELMIAFDRSRSLSSRLSGVWHRLRGTNRT